MVCFYMFLCAFASVSYPCPTIDGMVSPITYPSPATHTAFERLLVAKLTLEIDIRVAPSLKYEMQSFKDPRW